jgi:hypothetical protein
MWLNAYKQDFITFAHPSDDTQWEVLLSYRCNYGRSPRENCFFQPRVRPALYLMGGDGGRKLVGILRFYICV